MAGMTVAQKKEMFVREVKEKFGYSGTLTQEQVQELKDMVENQAPRMRNGKPYFWLSDMRDELWLCWDEYWGGHHSGQAFIYRLA
jgi:hypothetical protein